MSLNERMNRDSLEITLKNSIFPTFQKPVIVGFYCLDKNRTYLSSAKNLKYLYRSHSKTKLDLNEGYSTYQEKKQTLENEEKIDTLLHWLLENPQLYQSVPNPQMEKMTFVCFRGLLTTIMRTPYENQEDWLICASKVRNFVFLCAFHTEEKKRKLMQGSTAKEKLFEYWGRKFEQYMLSDFPRQPPNLKESVNASEEFDLVFRSKLNNHYILYGAEMDGVDSSEPVSTNVNELNHVKFVELKTSRCIQNERQRRNFHKFKLIKWWSQSFMVGIENIVCGFRDDDGIVRQVEEFRTKDLPKISDRLWSPCICMSFLDDFLSFVEVCLRKDEDFATWKFYWKPGGGRVRAEKVLNSFDYCIFPDWFVDQFTANLRK